MPARMAAAVTGQGKEKKMILKNGRERTMSACGCARCLFVEAGAKKCACVKGEEDLRIHHDG